MVQNQENVAGVQREDDSSSSTAAKSVSARRSRRPIPSLPFSASDLALFRREVLPRDHEMLRALEAVS